jgi:hypothetical protein
MDNSQKPRRSLKDEIQKRRTQQIEREIQARRLPQTARPPSQETSQPSPATQSAGSAGGHKRTTQTTAVRSESSTPPRWTAPRFSPRLLIVVAGAATGVIILLMVGLLGGNATPAPAPSQAPLPVVSAQDVINYLRLAGVPVSGLRALKVPNENWQATEEFQFDVQRGDQKGIFLLLSYPSTRLTSRDSFNVSLSTRFKGWQQIAISNILLMISPDSAKPIGDEIANHLSQYLVAPYRAYVGTSTGQPVIALATGAAATSTALRAATGQVTLVTLTPTGTPIKPTMTATPIRPTRTPTSTATETPPILTLPARVTAIPPRSAPGAASKPTDDGFVVMTPVASITASGALIEPQIDTAQAFVAAAPKTVGPFVLNTDAAIVDAHRSSLIYTTGPGQEYQVVLWITDTASEAQEHYQAETSTVDGAQPVSVGDEAIVAPPGNPLLAEMRYRNTVLAIYRPEQSTTDSSAQISNDQAGAFLAALFDAIPT